MHLRCRRRDRRDQLGRHRDAELRNRGCQLRHRRLGHRSLDEGRRSLDEERHHRHQPDEGRLDDQDRRHQPDEDHQDAERLDDPCPDLVRMGCCPGEPSGEEFPYPGLPQMGCYQGAECPGWPMEPRPSVLPELQAQAQLGPQEPLQQVLVLPARQEQLQ